ncbi:hypothetical protein GCM10007094_44740 [Pseudovibrio japonicus]|uniref:Hint domain-containing protein n=1 Tax=Pseudovibrio japonicus TaxID=366534 RepID=A0ABQ3EXR7_9HYPH|nr:Hint domain-containing protein [Pseudovibrio japonicus]GHB50683.1 hypothetical protein GCM10007094_44740 [Pseudovibrio japonicus]
MNVVIDEATIKRALELNDKGLHAEAYMLLTLAGDNYAASAYRIVSGLDNIYVQVVQNIWENERPGSVALDWENVAGVHQRNYLNYLRLNNGRLPDTRFIEDSYADALDDFGYPPHMAIDIVLNTLNEGVEGDYVILVGETWVTVDVSVKWYEILGLNNERYADTHLTLEDAGAARAALELVYATVGPAFDFDTSFDELFRLIGASAFKDATFYSVADALEALFAENSNPSYDEIAAVLVDLQETSPWITTDSLQFVQSVFENLPDNYKTGWDKAPQLMALLRDVLETENGLCFLPGTPILLPDGSEKRIEEIVVGDLVQSYNASGDLVVSRVSKVFHNQSQHILDVFGLMVTPGHVTYCGEGPFAGQHVPMIDILRSDGALMKSDGTLVRASTGCVVGSEGDALIWAVTGERRGDGTVAIKEKAQIRAGSRFILDDGRDICLLDLIKAAGGALTGDGSIKLSGSEAALPFHWIFSESLPAPEDYVLQRSQLSLKEIYGAGKWEGGASNFSGEGLLGMRKLVTRSTAQIAAGTPNIPFSLLDKSN